MVSIRDSLFGTLAVRAGFVTKEEVEECLAAQESYRGKGGRVPRLGELLAQQDRMTTDQVRSVLKGQHAAEQGLFGETAVRLAFTTREQVRECLDAQRSGRPGKLGQILAEMRHLTPAQVHAVLEAQGKRLVRCPGCGKSITAAGLVSGKQVTCPGCGKVSSAVEAKPAPRAQLAAEFEAKAQESPAEKKIEIGGYEILTRLGTDGTGTYCKARHLKTDAVCALKIMSPQAMSDKAFVKRFIEEGKKGTALQHRNIKRLYEVGVDKGRYYFSTEYVEGVSLRRVLEGGKKLPPPQAIDVGIKAGEALEYAHSRGVLHGDVRPSNVIIAEDGTVKVAALGLAKDVGANLKHFARSKEVTAFYLAPEQAVDDTRVDHRTDVYSLGATLYHMVTGRPPYEGDSPLEILMRMSEEELPAPGTVEPRVPVELSRVIMKMLADEPGKRHQSMAECLAELRRVRELVAAGKATYSTGARPPVQPTRRARTVKIPKTRRGLATVGAGDKEAIGTSPRFTGLHRPAGGGKKTALIIGVIVVVGGALAGLWFFTGPSKSYGDQARQVRREKEDALQEDEAEIEEAARRGRVVAEEYKDVMKFARENEGSPEAIPRLERFIERHRGSLQASYVKEKLDHVKASQAKSELAAINERASAATPRYAELVDELDSWLKLHPSHGHAELARSLKAKLEEREAGAFREAMGKVDALAEQGDWKEALAALDRADAEFRETFAAEARRKRKEVEGLHGRLKHEEEAKLAAERAKAEEQKKETEALQAFAGATRSALEALHAFEFGRAREALMEARAPVRGTPREKDLETFLAGVELARGALASLRERFKAGLRLEVTRAAVRTPVSAIDESGVTVTIETRGRKLDFPIPWKRLSPEDLYSTLSVLADWKDPEYLVGAALLCMASEKPKLADSFLASAAKRTDVSFYKGLAERAPAPAPEEAPPEVEPEAAAVPAPGEAPAAAGETVLDLSKLEEMGGRWDHQEGKVVGQNGSMRTQIAGLESVSGTFTFSGLDGSAEVTAGKWSLKFELARKQLACGAGGGQDKALDFPAALNAPYGWSIRLEEGQAVFKVGTTELARFPSQRQDGQLWFSLITKTPVTISGVRLKQTGERAPAPVPTPAAGAAAPKTPTTTAVSPTPSATGPKLGSWTIGEGEWKMDEAGVLSGYAKEGAARISHPISKPFVIEVEMEGRAQLAGISFGEAKDFIVPQVGMKQTLRLEVKDTVRFLVDGQETQSAGHSVRAKRPASIGNEFMLVVEVGRVRFKVRIEEGG